MATLRLRLAGPQQSWGTRARFDIRDSEVAPTKSGVIGLVAAALGLARDADIAYLAQLRMGARADRPGVRMSDYQTALDVVSSDGKPSKDAVVSKRAYLADAAFLVGLESADRVLLQHISRALIDPKWPLFLGRRAFPPSLPIAYSDPNGPDAVVDQPLEMVLSTTPPIVEVGDHARLMLYVEDPSGDQEWFDQPLNDFRQRGFRPRRVRITEIRWSTQ